MEAFVGRSKNALRIVGAALALVVLIAWDHPTPLTVLGVVIALVVYLGIVELLGRGARVDRTT